MAKKTIKERYQAAEPVVDGFLLKWTKRLIESPYTLAIVIVICLTVFAWRLW